MRPRYPFKSQKLTELQNDFFVVGSEDGTVTKYSLHTNSLDEVLTRCTLPIRDLAVSPDGNWVAVASEYVLLPFPLFER